MRASISEQGSQQIGDRSDIGIFKHEKIGLDLLFDLSPIWMVSGAAWDLAAPSFPLATILAI
jgi:hypothetical protein